MARHVIVVGNIGRVYDGANGFVAAVAFDLYVRQSKRNEGSAAGESVFWVKDGDVHREYIGSLARQEGE